MTPLRRVQKLLHVRLESVPANSKRECHWPETSLLAMLVGPLKEQIKEIEIKNKNEK